MKFASIGSGSSGNATLVSDGETLILIDCGFTIKETEKRLARFDIQASDIDAIVVTHEHSDHVKGVAPLARKYNIPVFMTEGTFACRDYGTLPALELICHYAPFTIASFTVYPVAVPHDAREPAQFVFEQDELRLGILTDLGSVTSHVIDAYHGCHGLLVEANHDIKMLTEGPYPYSLKRRVASPWGHLNNGQTASLLRDLHLENIQRLVVGHISQTNNSVDCVKRVLQDVQCNVEILYACQDEGFEWQVLEKDSYKTKENSKAQVLAC